MNTYGFRALLHKIIKANITGSSLRNTTIAKFNCKNGNNDV